MQFSVVSEFGELKTVVVARGDTIPDYAQYATDDPEFTKFHPFAWKKERLLRQHAVFCELLDSYGVELIFPESAPPLIWQLYARDTGFVVGEQLFYAAGRKMVARNGEDKQLLAALDAQDSDSQSFQKRQPLRNTIEGGDVLVLGEHEAWVGLSSRTSRTAIAELSDYIEQVRVFPLGEQVMHLDTRLTILSDKVALAVIEAFTPTDREFLSSRFTLIPVTLAEAARLGTNVLLLNPETVVAAAEHPRIASELRAHGFKVEVLEYDEPVNLGGAFRCTTLPLVRG